MSPKHLHLPLYVALACSFGITPYLPGREGRPVYAALTAHEWGTFTSIAGSDGEAVQWLPLTGSRDLPGFVEHFRNAGFKLGLRGTVRMETPVLYFYSSQEETVSVRVGFARGVITEWYPHASRVGPAANLFDGSLYQEHLEGSIAWDSVTISPTVRAEFPHEIQNSPYYAARLTSATPLRVRTPAGEQQEKFLFYRGAAAFPVPISATLTNEGRVRLENRGEDLIPNTILFERRGERVSYRVGGAVQSEATLDAPEPNATVEELARELEGMLVAQGLYQDEARAMVETWRDSWFEEGSRLLYIVPGGFVNAVLPLTINPAPSQLVRVFVGRLEIVTPATEKAVEEAFAAKDSATLAKYGRFLEPILEGIIRKEANPARSGRFREYLNAYYSAEMARRQSGN